MAKIFITGSADGLGHLAAKRLISLGHQVVLHARSKARACQAIDKAPGAMDVLVADLSSMSETRELAAKANELGAFDAVIHNAGLYQVPANSITTDGLPLLFAVNSLSPYILTCLMDKPGRLIYMTSGMHTQGDASLDNLNSGAGNNPGRVSYSDTKLHNVLLAMAVARRLRGVFSNAVNPGWVPTKMGGAGAPDDLEKGFETQVWLAVSNDAEACVSGRCFHHKKQTHYYSSANDTAAQDKFLAICEKISGVRLPDGKS